MLKQRLTLPLEKSLCDWTGRIHDRRWALFGGRYAAGMGTKVSRFASQSPRALRGNLCLKFTVAPHPFFKVGVQDVFCQVPVTPN
jgi:curved DNA-binding protein